MGEDFVFSICLKQPFLATIQFWEAQKYLGGTIPECPPVATDFLAGLTQLATASSRVML